MTSDDELVKLKEENETLKKQLEEVQSNETGFDELKSKYEKVIEEKNKELKELGKTNETLKSKIDSTTNSLNEEVQDKLRKVEELESLQKTVEELVVDKATATVDKYIQEGKILPAQRDVALRLCLQDNDTFLELYRDAKPIVEIQQERRSIPTGTAERIANYFKK